MVVCGAETCGEPELTGALPLEYLERLHLQNSIFGDDVRIEGVAREDGKLATAFDAHPGNFVKDDNGVVLPIDLILLRADEALQRALAKHLG